MKLNLKERMEQAKGITLIALIITIIVLLILAGVTIATLTGDNGILNQAAKAKDKTTEAESIERVQVEVVGSYGLDGKIDVGQLNKNLKNIKGLTYNGNALSDTNKITNLPATVTLNGYRILIDKNGETTTIPEGVSNLTVEIAMNPQAYYGKKVTNYKASDSDTNTYRIFYVDRDNYFKDGEYTIYLKADVRRIYYNLSNYASYDATNTKIRTMNPLWAAERGDSESGWNVNEKAVAYLCSPVTGDNYITASSLPWNEYYKPNDTNVNYVIGGPSVEMYVKSYNQAYSGIEDENVYTLGATYRATSVPGYIYTLNGAQSTISNSDSYTGTDSIDYQNYESMYCGQNGSKGSYYWWLASPSAYSSSHVCHVSGEDAALAQDYYDNNRGGGGLSPLVSLKYSFIPQVEE